jgi:hypothetical protein
LMKFFEGGSSFTWFGLAWTREIISLGPIPELNKIRGVPNEPAERMTRPFLVSGMKPFGPIAVLLV